MVNSPNKAPVKNRCQETNWPNGTCICPSSLEPCRWSRLELFPPACSTSILSHRKKKRTVVPDTLYGKCWLLKKKGSLYIYIYNWVGFHPLIFQSESLRFGILEKFAVLSVLSFRISKFPPRKIYGSWPRIFFSGFKKLDPSLETHGFFKKANLPSLKLTATAPEKGWLQN